MSVRGYAVAGGRSSRMGRDKALLPYRGTTLLEHAIATLHEVTKDVRVLCGPARRYEGRGAPVVEDAICGAGPLSGLYSALVDASADRRARILWLAIDLPLVAPSFLIQLSDSLDGADAVIAKTERGDEPLCAAFNTEPTLVAVRRALLAGRLKLTDALPGLRLKAMPGPATMFTNINSHADYEQLS